MQGKLHSTSAAKAVSCQKITIQELGSTMSCNSLDGTSDIEDGQHPSLAARRPLDCSKERRLRWALGSDLLPVVSDGPDPAIVDLHEAGDVGQVADPATMKLVCLGVRDSDTEAVGLQYVVHRKQRQLRSPEQRQHAHRAQHRIPHGCWCLGSPTKGFRDPHGMHVVSVRPWNHRG